MNEDLSENMDLNKSRNDETAKETSAIRTDKGTDFSVNQHQSVMTTVKNIFVLKTYEGKYVSSLTYYGDGKGIEEFHRDYKPSKVRQESLGCEWLRVHYIKSADNNPPQQKEDANHTFVEAFQESLRQYGARDCEQTCAAAKRLALKHGVRDGKWSWSVRRQNVDKWWTKVTRAIVDGDIPATEAAVEIMSIHETQKRLVINVFNDDFSNTNDVFLLKDLIRHIGVKETLAYQPTYYDVIDITQYGVTKPLYKDLVAQGGLKKNEEKKRPIHPSKIDAIVYYCTTSLYLYGYDSDEYDDEYDDENGNYADDTFDHGNSSDDYDTWEPCTTTRKKNMKRLKSGDPIRDTVHVRRRKGHGRYDSD